MAECEKFKTKRRAFSATSSRLMWKLLAVWLIVSFGFGILMVEPLNEYSIRWLQVGILVCPAGVDLCFYCSNFLFCCGDEPIEKR